MGNIFVGCRIEKKPEDHTTPELSKSEYHHMAEERQCSA